MFFGFAFIIGGLGLLMTLERLFPDRTLVDVPNWWVRVLTINLVQLIIVVTGAYTWEIYFQEIPSMFVLKELKFMTPALGGFLAYLTNSYIFYWFHRARHEIYLFWVLFHQVHHSPSRIEAITSFYKHPLEILIDSILMTILLYPVLGLSSASSIWLSIFSAYGEYFYHMNIKTPRFLGYFFQRPESHRIHHIRNKRTNCKNYSDFPFWDMLGNTFHNPETDIVPTGYSEAQEVRFIEMLLFKDVLKKKEKDTEQADFCLLRYESDKNADLGLNCTNFFSLCLLLIGLIQPIGYLFNQPNIRGLGAMTVASPLPLVFSAYNGVETFRTSFEIDLVFISPNSTESLNGLFGVLPDQVRRLDIRKVKKVSIPLSKEIYSQIQGPYNRRNVFGVLFSHGPFFKQPNIIELRDHLLRYAICENKLDLHRHLDEQEVAKVSKLDNLIAVQIKVTARRTVGFWNMWIICEV